MKLVSFMQIYNKDAHIADLPPVSKTKITATTTAEMKLTVTAFFKNSFLRKTLAH